MSRADIEGLWSRSLGGGVLTSYNGQIGAVV